MVLHQSCANNGGQASLIRLDHVPQLDQEVPLSEKALRALSIWQARAGEVVTVIDGQMTSYLARLTSLEEGSASCVPFQRLRTPVESPIQIEVYLSSPDDEGFEQVLHKLTELGVNRIVSIKSECTVTQEVRVVSQENSHSWPEVIRKASRQCRRAMLPEFLEVHSFTEALSCVATKELKLMLHEGDTAWSLTEGFGSFKPQSVALMVGPEGGFSAEEVEQAQTEGVLPVSLGSRILRTNTATIVAVALVQSYLGDLG
jgi:16S rRNA (uracil1498-N3)-methyltransferase